VGRLVKILVVDDEVAAAASLGNALRWLGHVPVVAVHPHDALDLLALDVDAVVTDIEMPEMNGVELAREIRGRNAEMPIAFCTGSDPSDGVAAEAASIGPVYPKTWTLASVKELIEALGK
jgi:CheY-like chemotaxis protein